MQGNEGRRDNRRNEMFSSLEENQSALRAVCMSAHVAVITLIKHKQYVSSVCF